MARAEYLSALAKSLRAADIAAVAGSRGRQAARRKEASTGQLREVHGLVEEHLRAARRCAGDSETAPRRLLRRRPFDVFTGANVEGAFTRLHDAEVLLVDLLPDEEVELRSIALERQMRASSAALDPRYAAAIEGLTVSRLPAGRACPRRRAAQVVAMRRRAAYRQALHAEYSVVDEQFARVRSFRNVVLLAAVGLMLLVLALGVVGWLAPDQLDLCFEAEQENGDGTVSCPSGLEAAHPFDASLVMLLGLAGAGLSTAVAIRSVEGSSGPFAVPLALTVLKVASGALTSVLGLLIIRGDFVPGLSRLDSQGQVLAYAVALGYAQQLLTGFIDRQAHTVLNRVPVQLPPEAATTTGSASAGSSAAPPSPAGAPPPWSRAGGQAEPGVRT